jgi:hypothetical protein
MIASVQTTFLVARGGSQCERTLILLAVNRRRFICIWFNIRWLSCTFFLPTSSPPQCVSIGGDRRLEGSSAQHANVYLRSRRIHVWDICRYVVYVWTWHMG